MSYQTVSNFPVAGSITTRAHGIGKEARKKANPDNPWLGEGKIESKVLVPSLFSSSWNGRASEEKKTGLGPVEHVSFCPGRKGQGTALSGYFHAIELDYVVR